MLICFHWKGSGGGVVYGCGVWRVKSWVKNVLNTNKYIAIFLIKWGWSPLTYLPLVVIIFEKSIILFYWTPYRGIETYTSASLIVFLGKAYWTPYRGIDTPFGHRWLSHQAFDYWTPYRGIEMLICFPWKGSGGGVVYGFGVWRVNSWVKNVLNTNKYIAIFSIKWGWSPLTYLPLVVIIFEKSIILFYWISFRGLMLAIKNLFIFWPLLNPLYGIDTTLREWGIRNEEWAINNYLSRLNRGSRGAGSAHR